jgi:hypothetical protein
LGRKTAVKVASKAARFFILVTLDIEELEPGRGLRREVAGPGSQMLRKPLAEPMLTHT